MALRGVAPGQGQTWNLVALDQEAPAGKGLGSRAGFFAEPYGRGAEGIAQWL